MHKSAVIATYRHICLDANKKEKNHSDIVTFIKLIHGDHVLLIKNFQLYTLYFIYNMQNAEIIATKEQKYNGIKYCLISNIFNYILFILYIVCAMLK